MAIPKVGGKAPHFSVPNQDDKTVSLKQFAGKSNVVLYFYPKDSTPGCTVEACGFRDGVRKIESLSAVVLGVSPDSTASHRKFIEKFELPFVLLSDEDKTLCKAYGVWVKKSMYGREYMGVARTTFIIDKLGQISHVFEKVKPDGHPNQVLEALKSLG